MIKRTIRKTSAPAERLQEASFTGTKGIDVSSPPTQRESALELTNLDVALDGSLTLRKPLLNYRNYPNSLICEYIFNNNLLIFDNLKLYIVESSTDTVKDIYYNGKIINNTLLIENGIDLTQCNITNTGTSTILSNVLIDLKIFESGKYYNSTLGDAYDNKQSFITSTYFKLEYLNNKYILKYIKPDIANLNSSETISLNPNTATYYTFAVRDNYKSSVTSIEGILAYTSNNKFDTETIADLTESAKHSVIESVTNDFSESIILKAFLNIAYTQGSKYYLLWEKTYDNVTWSEVPEFYTKFKTVTLKIEDTSKINANLENNSVSYLYRRAVLLETPNMEKDLLTTRPDVLNLNTLDRAIYRCSIYVIYDNKIVYSSKEVQSLENTPSTAFTYESSIIRFFKKKGNTDTSFTIKYYVEDIDNFIINSFSAKMIRNGNPIDIPLTITKNKEISEGFVVNQYIEIKSNNPYVESFSKLQYDASTVGIFIYYDGLYFDAVRYSFTAYEYSFFENTDAESKYINVPILVSGPSCRSNGTFVFEVDFRQLFKYNNIKDNINDITKPNGGGTLKNFSSSEINYAYPRLFFSIIDIEDCIQIELEAGTLNSNYESNDIAIKFINYFGISGEYKIKYKSDFWKYYKSAVSAKASHFYYEEQISNIYDYYVAGIYRNDTVYEYTIATYLIYKNTFSTDFITDIPNWILNNENKRISLPSVTPTVYIEDPTGSESQGTIENTYLLSTKQWSLIVSDTINIIQSDISNTCKGKKLYYKNKIYTYGVEEFKNNIFVSDSDSFITPLYNIIDLNMTSESKVTTLVPWRDYLLAASETGIYLIKGSGEEVTSKAINTYIGIPSKDSATCKAILNGIVFKSGSKIYSLQPSMYSSDDTILNIVDISKPVANYIKDSNYNNFAFTTERAYYLFIPDDNSTTCLKYEYARKIWTKYVYPVRLYKYYIKSIDDIYVFSNNNSIYYFEKDLDSLGDVFKDTSKYGDYLTNFVKCTPITFTLDTGQKTDNLSSTKQFVESKFIFATLSDKDMFPIDIAIYIDGLHFKDTHIATHIDTNTDAAFFKTEEQALGSLSTNFTSDDSDIFNVLRQMFIRYSGKGKTIRHIISGKSNFNFKIYVVYYRYKISHNKQ